VFDSKTKLLVLDIMSRVIDLASTDEEVRQDCHNVMSSFPNYEALVARVCDQPSNTHIGPEGIEKLGGQDGLTNDGRLK
jgi:hypothetical protein